METTIRRNNINLEFPSRTKLKDSPNSFCLQRQPKIPNSSLRQRKGDIQECRLLKPRHNYKHKCHINESVYFERNDRPNTFQRIPLRPEPKPPRKSRLRLKHCPSNILQQSKQTLRNMDCRTIPITHINLSYSNVTNHLII